MHCKFSKTKPDTQKTSLLCTLHAQTLPDAFWLLYSLVSHVFRILSKESTIRLERCHSYGDFGFFLLKSKHSYSKRNL